MISGTVSGISPGSAGGASSGRFGGGVWVSVWSLTRAAVTAQFRVRTDRAGWAILGTSTGGFCAANLAMRHPDRYAAAASLSGYFTAITDRTTGDLYRGDQKLRNENSPLWRLKNLLGMLAEGRRELPGLGGDNACLKQLSEQADYLHETVEKAHEQLLTLLDLHLNIASYDVNRFMRLLAVVSSLALIPTIIGGLLGMNVAGNPWPVTLSQIAFGTLILMLCVLYAFLAKGWLR